MSRSEFQEESRQHFNEPILIGFSLCRCVGYAEDEEDCYLVVCRPGSGIEWCSFVGGYTYLSALKGQGAVISTATGEVWDDFTRLDSLLELNGAPRETKLIIIGIGQDNT